MELGAPHIDFNIIHTSDPKYFMVADLSKYLHLYNSPAIIEITLPGSEIPKVFNIVKNELNSFNSNNLGISCLSEQCDYVDLPDGIWKVTIKASPDTFFKTRYYLKSDLLRLELDKIYVENGMQYDPKTEDFLRWSNEAELYMLTADAAVRTGDLTMTKNYFDQATKMVGKKSKCKDCY